MELIPAVDLRAGRVVRLSQGDFGRETGYSDDPLAVVAHWVGEGAGRLHVVDLDGAREGRPVQAPLVGRVVRSAGVPIQVAGGLRDDAAVAEALASGADRVVLGSTAIADPAAVGRLVERHGSERIVGALDVRDGRAVGGGWSAEAPARDALALARLLREAGVATFVVTAIARDGLMGGPDLELLESVAAVVGPGAVIASGGIGSLDDLAALAERGFGGAILGRALYEERFTLAQATAAAADAGR